MNPLARFAAWLAGLRFTLATIAVTRDPASPAERDLRETAPDHSLDARQLLAELADGQPGMRLGPSSPP